MTSALVIIFAPFWGSCPGMQLVNVVTLLHRYLQGITTYEYVVAMRAQSDPPGPSVHDDQQSLASSPMSSAPTAFSGSSFARHYKGAWCTPPRIFIDQVSIVCEVFLGHLNFPWYHCLVFMFYN